MNEKTTKETRVGYMTIDILATEEKKNILDCWERRDLPQMVYHINKYRELEVYLKTK